MGLDVIEIMLEVEDEFGISIPDQEAAQIVTVGELIAYVQDKAARAPEGACRSSHVFYRLRRAIVDHLGIERRTFAPASLLSDLIAPQNRRKAWAYLKHEGLNVPNLRLARPQRALIAMASLVSAAAIAWQTGRPWLLLLSLPLMVVAAWLARPLATTIPSSCPTVRSLVVRLMPTKLSDPLVAPSRSLIAQKVRVIIAEQLELQLDQITDERRLDELL